MPLDAGKETNPILGLCFAFGAVFVAFTGNGTCLGDTSLGGGFDRYPTFSAGPLCEDG